MRVFHLAVFAACAFPLGGCARRAPAPPTEAAKPAPDPAAVSANIEQALVLRKAGKQLEALAMLDQARLDALEAKRPDLATLAVGRRGDVANDLGRKEEARRDYETAYAEAEARSDLVTMGRSAHDRALVNTGVWGAGDPDALTWYPKAVEARLKAGDLVGVRRSANNLAIQYLYGHQKESALRWFGEALKAGEQAKDWDGVYKVHANLALLHAVDAEGAFAPDSMLRVWVPPAKLDAAAEALAHEHFAKAIEAAGKVNATEADACGVLGNYGARCLRLSPGAKPAEAMVAFFAQLALEAEAGGTSSGDTQLQSALLCLRAADAARDAGPELSKQVPIFEKTARDHFDAAAKEAGSVEALCVASPHTTEVCARLRAPEKKAPKKKAAAARP